MGREEYFNPATYMIIDRITGEEIPAQIFVEKVEGKYWEKAYVKTLSDYIGSYGTSSSLVLSYLIKEKTIDNFIHGTINEIAAKTKVSRKTVISVFSVLTEKKLLSKVRNGCYLLSPYLLRHGSQFRGAVIIRLWENLQPQIEVVKNGN